MGKFFIGVLCGIAAMRFGPGLLDQFTSDVDRYTRITHLTATGSRG